MREINSQSLEKLLVIKYITPRSEKSESVADLPANLLTRVGSRDAYGILMVLGGKLFVNINVQEDELF